MNAPTSAETRQRLFFALWPPCAIAERIIAVADKLEAGGQPIARDQLHVTLAFHGLCDSAARDALIARAERADRSPIDLVFDRLGYFRRPRIVWLGLSEPPTKLCELAAVLRGFDLDQQRFVPHISLQRKAAPMTAGPITPISWRAREFALVESGANGVPGGYRILARWPLLGAGASGSDVE